MFLSKIHLNPQRRKTRDALANPQVLHAMVASSLPPGMDASTEGRLLWRVDRIGHDVRLYIVSPYEPGLEHIVEQVGWAADPGQTTDYSRFLHRLARGQEYDFRITLNPVKQQWIAGSRGKRIPICRPEEQLAWFRDRGPRWGFEIPRMDVTGTGLSSASADPEEFDAIRILQAEDRAFDKRDQGTTRRVTQRHVTFVGRLVVTDPDLFRNSLTHGMGRGKAYGCGLMSLSSAG